MKVKLLMLALFLSGLSNLSATANSVADYNRWPLQRHQQVAKKRFASATFTKEYRINFVLRHPWQTLSQHLF